MEGTLKRRESGSERTLRLYVSILQTPVGLNQPLNSPTTSQKKNAGQQPQSKVHSEGDALQIFGRSLTSVYFIAIKTNQLAELCRINKKTLQTITSESQHHLSLKIM